MHYVPDIAGPHHGQYVTKDATSVVEGDAEVDEEDLQRLLRSHKAKELIDGLLIAKFSFSASPWSAKCTVERGLI